MPILNDTGSTIVDRDTHTSIVEVTAPTEAVVTLAEAKLHLRIDTKEDNAYVNSLVSASTGMVQGFTRRQLVTATFELFLDNFVTRIDLKRSPLLAVNSVKYLDTGGTLTTLAASEYTVDIKSELGRVFASEGNTWPSTQLEINAVTVNFDAGYGAASAVPDELKQSVLMYAHDLYENRGHVSERLLRNNKTAFALLQLFALPRMV